MNIDNKKYLRILDFDKILSILSEQACCNDTKKLLLTLQPSSCAETVKLEISKTDDAYKLSCQFGSPPIQPLTNIIPIIKRTLIGSRLSMSELLNVAHLLKSIFQILVWKKHCNDTNSNLDYLFDKITPIKHLENKIFDSILSEDEISDNASPELYSIRKKIISCSSKIRDSLDKFIKSPTYQKYLQEPIITIRDGRFVIPVKTEYKNEIKGLIHDTSTSGSTLFIEPMNVVDANNQIKILEGLEKDEIDKILDNLSSEVALNANILIENYNNLIYIDFYFAKAKLAITMDAIVPKINDNGKIMLLKARHPLIDKSNIVPININLGINFDTLVITGPNTGGKTVALKTVGLLTIMAMSGLMIPAGDNSEISVFNNVLSDIGDEQSIEQNLSTFSSHMTNIISILNHADKNSLILMDELGAGTDPIEGASLAISILEELKSKSAKIIATTHYPEIKTYALKTNRVENACCEFNIETLKPTYKLLIGLPGKSNAFLISQKLGLNQKVINSAKNLISSENTKFEEIISEIEQNRIEIENQKNEISKLKIQIQNEKLLIEKIKQETQNQQETQINNARKEAKKIVSQVKSQSESILKEIDSILEDKNNENFYKMAVNLKSQIKSKFKNLDNLADPITINKNPSHISRPIKAGDYVKILDTNQKGIVLSNQNSNEYVKVQTGIMKTNIHISNLSIIDQNLDNKTKKPNITKQVSSKFNGKIESEIHLRGLNVEEALFELDKFIDNSILMGLKTIRIIHGKGTGTLRAAVKNFLKDNKYIKSYRLGLYGEGEDGVTIVNLK